MPACSSISTAARDVARVGVDSRRRARSASCGRGLGDARDRRLGPAVEDGDVLGHARSAARPRRARRGRCRRRRGRASRSSARETVNGARSSTSGSTAALRGHDALDARRRRARRRGRGWWPSAPSRAGRRSRRACARRAPGSGARAPRRRAAPAGLGDRRVARAAGGSQPLPCRLPMPERAGRRRRRRAAARRRRSPSSLPSSASSPCSTMSPSWKRTPCGDLAPAAACAAAGTRGPSRSA